MPLNINSDNYPRALDRLDYLWSQKNISKEALEELEVLMESLSDFEERFYPIFNNPTYKDLFNARFKRK